MERLSMYPAMFPFGPLVEKKSKPLTARAVAPPPNVPLFHPSSHVEPHAVPSCMPALSNTVSVKRSFGSRPSVPSTRSIRYSKRYHSFQLSVATCVATVAVEVNQRISTPTSPATVLVVLKIRTCVYRLARSPGAFPLLLG